MSFQYFELEILTYFQISKVFDFPSCISVASFFLLTLYPIQCFLHLMALKLNPLESTVTTQSGLVVTMCCTISFVRNSSLGNDVRISVVPIMVRSDMGNRDWKLGTVLVIA